MKRVLAYLHAYHPIVHALMLGTVFISLTSSMSLPFLAIYLREAAQLDYATIGLIIGAGPLAGTFSGFFGGLFSDFLGRSRLMVLSLIGLAAAFIGFVATKDPWLLLVFSVLRGVSASFYNTISKALMGDVTPREQRYRVFSNRYLAVNLGFSIGPALGALLGTSGSAVPFLITAGVYLLFASALALFLRAIGLRQQRIPDDDDRMTLSAVWQVLHRDHVLFLLIAGGMLLITVHGEMSVSLSQYLKDEMAGGVQLFAWLMSVNGMTVLLLQVPLTRWAERFSLFRRIAVGSALLAAGEAGFAFSDGWTGFIVSMLVFTFGEILVVPAEFALIDHVTPSGLRGTYYGAQSFSELGNFLGPWLGGVVLAAYGGTTMFLMFGGIALVSLIFFAMANRLIQQQRDSETRSSHSPTSA